MTSIAPTILLVDDDPGCLQATSAHAKLKGCKVITATSFAAASDAAMAHTYDLALVDISLPDGNGLDLIERIALSRHGQAIVLTGYPTVDSAIRTVRLPAADYLVKPIRGEQLEELLDRARASAALRHAEGAREPRCGALIGHSRAMRALFDKIERVAPMDITVLIHGESGTGKELAARAVHELSGRKGRFVAVNCGAVAPELLPSEMFGHERGSFTGAVRDHAGYFEQAEGGTLFLDEFTEMPLALQTHLLRVLEERRVTRVGSHKSQPVDVRVVAACNRVPAEAVDQGLLRQDLYYRLMDFPIRMPALREHPEDIPYIAAHLLDQLNERYETARQFSAEAVARLMAHHWPGNVRELRHVIQRAFVLAEETIEVPASPEAMEAPLRDKTRFDMHVGMSLEEMEKRALLGTLEYFNHDKARTADVLGISLKTIYNKLARYASSDELAHKQ
ncbi:sigma-54 dependent transcriptional regulator [Dyella marensis]|uniref:DNA-binding transcriptional response regulator, NtrC family, contains REC, AAA-type ATPase, and a Fis-type DNA-binding domains n=1 Tax=Dyella marensis TaxID=500610 RepID=A0A1I1ZQC6_9GAMM|nr:MULTISPECIES: sigma-54 dependent transcriptional regulator [Dyella]SFE33871.1 DNA-binding transcriptional response regulator, NtrC family, contains REC, AAA-type ATPase, and a Fis-type DNA-binding domains [Dyella marensis]